MRLSLLFVLCISPAMAQGIWIWEPYDPNPKKIWPEPPPNLPEWAVWLDGQLIAEPNYFTEP